jgi:hypothetical protein
MAAFGNIWAANWPLNGLELAAQGSGNGNKWHQMAADWQQIGSGLAAVL